MIQIRVSADAFGCYAAFKCPKSKQIPLFICSQEVTGDDDSDLYLAEREEELKKEQEAKRAHQLTVPGIVGPHDQPESMQDELDFS